MARTSDPRSRSRPLSAPPAPSHWTPVAVGWNDIREFAEPACKPDSVPAGGLRPTTGGDHSSSPDGCPWGPAAYPGAWVGPTSCAPLFGLAPCGVCPARRVTTPAVRSYRTFSPLPPLASQELGGMFSVALSLGSPPLAVSQHTALRSPDGPPQLRRRAAAIARPALRTTQD